MSKIFYNDKILAEFEKNEQWDKSVIYLNEKLHLNPKNKSILFRLAAQCWYVLTFWDCTIPNQKLNRALFESHLKKAYTVAKKNWWNDSNCLWLFGYFMYINQMDFWFVSSDIREIESIGKCLISKAYSINKYNLPAKVLYLSDKKDKRKYNEAIKTINKNINDFFSEQSAVELYFAEILTSQ